MKDFNYDSPKLFLTDYASYNEGTQFEFGHWVDLDQFSDALEFSEYIDKHFQEADEKRPLECGTPREETMFTDFENFPREFYSESMCGSEMEELFQYLNLEDDEKIKVEFMREQGASFEYALEKLDDCRYIEDDDKAIYEEFEMYYPDADKLYSQCPYISIDYDQFKRENYTEFTTSEGENLLFEDSWNH